MNSNLRKGLLHVSKFTHRGEGSYGVTFVWVVSRQYPICSKLRCQRCILPA